jgi:hypothetical protein
MDMNQAPGKSGCVVGFFLILFEAFVGARLPAMNDNAVRLT